MNRRTPGLETVKAIQGFRHFKVAEGLSVRTIESYLRDLHQKVEYMGVRQVGQITVLELRQYLVHLLTEYQPHRLTGNNEQEHFPKTVRNVRVTISAFFHWGSDEFKIFNPIPTDLPFLITSPMPSVKGFRAFFGPVSIYPGFCPRQ